MGMEKRGELRHKNAYITREKLSEIDFRIKWKIVLKSVKKDNDNKNNGAKTK